MSTQHIDTVIARLAYDHGFRAEYAKNPDRALEGYLTPDEIRAIKTGDGYLLYRLGSGEKWGDLTVALCGPDPGP